MGAFVFSLQVYSYGVFMAVIEKATTQENARGLGSLISGALATFNRFRAKRTIVPASVNELTQPSIDRLTYSEEEFKTSVLVAETDVLIAENAGEKRMIRIYQIDPDAPYDANADMSGTVHMISKDNLHGVRSKLSE